MKPKTLILMVVAISCGLGASYMTSRLLADRQSDVEKISILIAKKPINMGDTIKTPDDVFVEKFYPKGEEPKMAISEPDKLKGRQLKRPLRVGDFVTPDDLMDERDPGLRGMLPQGHVAVGIRVNPESIAGGFASLPHSRVNIINVVRRGNDRDSYSKIILENVLVLAADQSTRMGDDGSAKPANVVTVALKPEDSLRLELAKQMGTISLTLRKFNDTSKAENNKITVEQMNSNGGNTTIAAEEPSESGGSPPLPTLPPLAKEPVKEAAVKPAPVLDKEALGQKHVLIITEGDQQRQVQFRLDENGRPIRNEVQRSGVVAAPVQSAPAPVPAPKNDDAPPDGN